MSYLHHVPPSVLWLDHVHPSSSQTESRATLQFPDCITCSPPVPWLYHMLPSSKVRSPPWETPEVREAKAEIKHRLRQARNTKSDKDWSELRSHQAEYHRLRSHTTKTKFKEFCQTMESKSTPKRISSIIKNHKTTRLGTVRKPDGRLTESPEETLQIMVDTHFTSLNAPPQDNPTGNNGTDDLINSGEDRTNTTLNSDLDRIFSPKRMKKSLAEFDPLSAAGPDGIRPVMLQKAWETINAAYTSPGQYRKKKVVYLGEKCSGFYQPKSDFSSV